MDGGGADHQAPYAGIRRVPDQRLRHAVALQHHRLHGGGGEDAAEGAERLLRAGVAVPGVRLRRLPRHPRRRHLLPHGEGTNRSGGMTWTTEMAAAEARPSPSPAGTRLAAAHRAARRLALPPGRTATATAAGDGGRGSPEAMGIEAEAEAAI
ncbi:Os02g0218550, partial [Oryza sativa Japonica Group]